jgi:hypothetical protein
MKEPHYHQLKLLLLFFLLAVSGVHGQSSCLSIAIEVGSNIRDLLAQQVLTVAHGFIAFDWNPYNRRSAMLIGPSGAINAVFTSCSHSRVMPKPTKDRYHLQNSTLIVTYVFWFFPCFILIFRNAWLGFALLLRIGLYQFFL